MANGAWRRSQSVSDLRNIAESLKNARGDTTILLQRGSQLLGTAADLVAKHKADLDCDLKSAYVTEIVGSTGPREPDVHALDCGRVAVPVVEDSAEPGIGSGRRGGRKDREDAGPRQGLPIGR